jgi:hypothetical protein
MMLAPSAARLRGAFLLTVSGVLFLPACAGEKRKPVFPVQGKVLFEGKPAAGAVVFFHPVGVAGADALRPHATVEADGTYRLTTYNGPDGAPAGEYDVTVVWTRPSRRGDEEGDSLLPVRYRAPTTSRLRAEVKEQPNELPPFKLTR